MFVKKYYDKYKDVMHFNNNCTVCIKEIVNKIKAKEIQTGRNKKNNIPPFIFTVSKNHK